MSRYTPSDYRQRDRSRSPPRFGSSGDRRASAASIFDNRPQGPARSASDAPRGPRSQFDGPRPAPSGAGQHGGASRPPYPSLRDAPPLSSGGGDRGRPYREREYDRRDRLPSPRDRSPPRNLKDTRDLAPRDVDLTRSRRESRDLGPPPLAGSSYPEGPPQSVPASFRGGFAARGRGRGEFPARGGRGGRAGFDDRDLIRRGERSPPRTWGRDLSRDSRDSDRRDERRFDRRDDERRPPDWQDRGRERDYDRSRREQPPSRLEARASNESIGAANPAYQSSQAPRINPDRLAMIEGATTEPPAKRPSIHQDAPTARDPKHDQPETLSYLNGRAATAASRYGTRGSSSPTQAPPVPAFTLSYPVPAPSSAPSNQTQQAPRSDVDFKRDSPRPQSSGQDRAGQVGSSQPQYADIAVTQPAPQIKAKQASPPPAAPRAPRGRDTDDAVSFGSRLQQTRSLENLPSQSAQSGSQPTPAATSTLPALNQPVTPHVPPSSRLSDLGVPTGPRANRASPAMSSVSPRPPIASVRPDLGSQAALNLPRASTPPATAPTGPRSRPYSVSPKAIPPTAPKADRGPPVAPRALDRGFQAMGRAGDRPVAPVQRPPPSAPRASQWNQWTRPGVPPFSGKSIPAKRDNTGEEKSRGGEPNRSEHPNSPVIRMDVNGRGFAASSIKGERAVGDPMEVEKMSPTRQSSLISGHSAAQSFFGKPAPSIEDDENDTGMSEAGQDLVSTSEEDDSEDSGEGELTLFHAKFEREKRNLEAQMVDLSQDQYRAMSPLECISRLVRINARDLQRAREARDREMDLDDTPDLQRSQLPPRTAVSSESADGPDLLTPRGEDDHRVAIRDNDDSSETRRHVRRPSPFSAQLPYLVKDRRHSFADAIVFRTKGDATFDADVLDGIDDELNHQYDIEDDIIDIFTEQYRKWREKCEDLDRVRDEQEKLERQQSLEPGPEVDAPLMTPLVPFEGAGRRLHKFNSEYEFEQVLKQSEETARIEQERLDRETKKTQADMEKEAHIPSQRTEEELKRSAFIDLNRFRDPKTLTTVFSYEPKPDTFTKEEQQIFIAAFKETPKKWGEIASLFEHHTYEECIRHYYANKWDNRFRDNRTKKFKAGGRRGRGGGRGPRGRMGGLMADLARAEDISSIDAMNERGRPKRAAAPTTFGEKEVEAKATLLGPSPAKKLGLGGKKDQDGDAGSEKSVKRQKRNGDKPGRKVKNGVAGQPLLAAAPQGSPAKPFLEPPGAQKLEDANLLTGFAGGHHVLNPEAHILYTQERYLQPMAAPEEPGPSKPGQGQAPKSSASSYWSVPEQQDFVKYISHFGHDFAAIAAHMGTKTQVMIKNHFQRQVEGGNKPEMLRAATQADERRARGEEIGPPPTPTPIQKRKYDTVPSSGQQRPLAPHADAMDIDEAGQPSRVHVLKHASPPQFQNQPRITTSSQNTPIQAPRVAPSPLATTVSPAQPPLSNATHMRPMQHQMGGRLNTLPESRPEARYPGYDVKANEEPPSRMPGQVPGRHPVDAGSAQFINNLREEQQRALQLQQIQEIPQQDRSEQVQRQNPLFRNISQGSPISQPLHYQQERKSVLDDRAPTPPRPPFMQSAFSRPPPHNQSLGPMTFAPISGRSFGYSPPKREEVRPAPLSSIPPVNTPPKSSTPAETKRMNVMSLLNNDDEPQPPKREVPTPVPQRTMSPAAISRLHSTSAAPQPTMPGMRREPSFGQTSLPQSQFGRMQFGQSTSTPVQRPASPKNEPISGNTSVAQTPNMEWNARPFAQSSQQSQANQPLERDAPRPYFQPLHRSSILGQLNQPRANPSPPPLGEYPHSRTPSLSTRNEMQAREQTLQGSMAQQQSSAAHQSAQALHPNPYGAQQMPPFSQAPSSQTHNHAHHAHNNSISGPFPSLHHRAISRDEQYRHQHEQAQAQAQVQAQRQRDEEELRWRHSQEEREAERRREEDARYRQQRQQQEQDRQQSLHRPPPQPLQPPPFSASSFGQSRGMVDIRRQSQMEVELAMRDQQDRQRTQDAERSRQEAIMQRDREEDYRRRQQQQRQQEEMYRRTPSGGGYGAPPPQPPRR